MRKGLRTRCLGVLVLRLRRRQSQDLFCASVRTDVDRLTHFERTMCQGVTSPPRGLADPHWRATLGAVACRYLVCTHQCADGAA
jgi:hypothetical protein